MNEAWGNYPRQAHTQREKFTDQFLKRRACQPALDAELRFIAEKDASRRDSVSATPAPASNGNTTASGSQSESKEHKHAERDIRMIGVCRPTLIVTFVRT